MTYVLLQKDTRLPATHAFITKFVRVIVETGCLTAISAIIQLALFIWLPDKPYFTCIGLALAKLYSNSLLAILNSRIRLEGSHNAPSAQVVRGSSLAFYERGGRRTALPYAREDENTTHVVDVRIQQHTETWIETDDIPMNDTESKMSPAPRDLDSCLSTSK